MSALTDYKTLVAKVMVRLAATDEAQRSTVATTLRNLGLPSDVTAKAEDIVLPAVEEASSLRGIPRDKLTPEAIAEFETEDLAEFRRMVYAELQRRSERLGMDYVRPALAELNLPAPKAVTIVEATVVGITQPGSEDYLSFSLQGDVSKDEVRAKLENIANHPVRKAMFEAFGEDQILQGVSPLVSALYVRPTYQWPSQKDITA